LLSTWTGLLAALGGPSWAPAIAPLGTALAVAAVTLFAGEAFGVAVAVPTALIFAGNFAVWWFGRFAMSEPLTIAFLWGGLVFLGRGAPLSAGVMLGLAGLARAETLLFAVGAVACWGAWMPVRGRDLLALAVGAGSVTTIAAAGLLAAPNHHVAYLTNDLQMARARASEYLMPAIWDGRVLTAFALLPLLPMSVATAAAWGRAPIVRTTARALVMFAVVVATMVYIRIGGKAEPVRHLGWLATSLSPLGLLLAIAGTGLVWIRGTPTARLAVILLVLIALVFVPSPRVATFQPWAMRRYLTVVLPMLALGAGVVIGTLVSSRRRVVQAIAAVALTAVVVVQVRPTLAARSSGYFAGSLAGVRALVDPIPADAIVVVDSSFADFQLQVAIWLVYGRETVMATSDGFAWRLLLPALVASGRPVYWVQNAWMQAPGVNGLTFEPVALNQDLTLAFPDSPADTPPAVVVRKAVRLNIYGVGSAVGRTQALPTGSSG
jgi:hypothetical protein